MRQPDRASRWYACGWSRAALAARIRCASRSLPIGGPGDLDDNVVAGNGINGVALRNGSTNNGWANLIQRNQIYANGVTTPGVGIGIDEFAFNRNSLEILIMLQPDFVKLDPSIGRGVAGDAAQAGSY